MNDQTKTILQWLGTGSIDIFGPPFSGKDTQGRALAKALGGELIAGGDILRSHHDPKKIEQVMAEGGIVPSDFYLQMVLPYLARPEFKAKPLILSAVGRAHGEEPMTMRAAADSGHPLRATVVLLLTEGEVWSRFEAAKDQHDRGTRSDDHRQVLKNRLKKFQDRTAPVIDFYRQKGLLIEVDGTGGRKEITNEILQKLAELATKP